MKLLCLAFLTLVPAVNLFAQMPPPDILAPGVSQELAKWRAAHYSDVRYKINLTLEKMSPVLKGSIEIRVKVGTRTPSSATPASAGELPPIILDWRKIRGHEEKSTIATVVINGKALPPRAAVADGGVRVPYEELNEHLIFRDGVVAGENVIKLDFTSPILTSGSAITRYLDKEDGSEYIYSLFVPSDASTAFPVFDQPNLKARFTLELSTPDDWRTVSNTFHAAQPIGAPPEFTKLPGGRRKYEFAETRPISTYVFAFAVGPWGQFTDLEKEYKMVDRAKFPVETRIFVRKSQYLKASDHITEVFRLNREAVKYFEEYFNYKYPFPKYDLVLIPEFPFGGMEHAGATFLRESSIIFPQEPTKNDLVNRATLIFHETAHQWFGDTVTMRWFDDLWLKEGFATFMGYKALEKIMPEMNAWKVFYERIKQGAYQTDSTKGTTPIYQEIKNLSAAKSAYGNIVYNKAPAFLRQAEFYLGEDKFQTAVRAFLKRHEYANAGWEDLVGEFESVRKYPMQNWAKQWVTVAGLPIIRVKEFDGGGGCFSFFLTQTTTDAKSGSWESYAKPLVRFVDGSSWSNNYRLEAGGSGRGVCDGIPDTRVNFLFTNYQDYGYGIFLLDEKSRDYVLKNIQNEKDPFLRSMMWGALWDSVREGELDPRQYVDLVVKVLKKPDREGGLNQDVDSLALPHGQASATDDESTVALLLNRVGTAMNYYIESQDRTATVMERATTPGKEARSITVASLPELVEDMLIERMRNASTVGQRITFYRAFLNIASSEKARTVLKDVLSGKFPIEGLNCSGGVCAAKTPVSTGPIRSTDPDRPYVGGGYSVPLYLLKTKDKFDIVTRLLILNDSEANKLLADLEKTETSDDAKRYAYAAKAGIPTAENKAKYWNDFTSNKEISESWIEAAFGPWNSIRHSEQTLPYLQKALQELPNHKRNRKIFFVNGWLGAFIGGQRSEEALAIVNKFLTDNPNLDKDLRLKILENVDLIERAVRIRTKYGTRTPSSAMRP
jgi:aminopeptidase N